MANQLGVHAIKSLSLSSFSGVIEGCGVIGQRDANVGDRAKLSCMGGSDGLCRVLVGGHDSREYSLGVAGQPSICNAKRLGGAGERASEQDGNRGLTALLKNYGLPQEDLETLRQYSQSSTSGGEQSVVFTESTDLQSSCPSTPTKHCDGWMCTRPHDGANDRPCSSEAAKRVNDFGLALDSVCLAPVEGLPVRTPASWDSGDWAAEGNARTQAVPHTQALHCVCSEPEDFDMPHPDDVLAMSGIVQPGAPAGGAPPLAHGRANVKSYLSDPPKQGIDPHSAFGFVRRATADSPASSASSTWDCHDSRGNLTTKSQAAAQANRQSPASQSSMPMCVDGPMLVALAESEPSIPEAVDGPMSVIPSEGSRVHDLGDCKPCAWYWSPGCHNGATCKFCHLCPEGEIGKRRRARKLRIQASKEAKKERERLEAVACTN